MYRKIYAGGVILAGLLCCGCGSGGTTVTGAVKYNGEPLTAAEVQFEGDAASKLGGFTARTDDQGEFEVHAKPPPAAIQPGKYRVLISKYVDRKGNAPEAEDYDQLKAAGELRNQIPRRYNDPNESVLFVDIKAGRNELPVFELKGPRRK